MPEPDSSAVVWFDEVVVGQRWTSPRRTITEADVVGFAGISGDFNPLHIDDVFASSGPFGRRLVHGMLVLSIATGLRQQLGIFQGSISAFLEVRSWRFTRPVFIGDTIVVVTTIASARETSRPAQGVVVQAIDVVNQDGELVGAGEFVTLMRARPREDA